MSRSLFDDQPPPPAAEPSASSAAPLAERMRPRRLDELVGHEQLVGHQGFLRRAIAEDRVPSLIFWGPPGSGKTTLARIIASATASRFVPFSAVTSGIKEVRQVMADAARLRQAQGQRTLLFIDEIHRFNRSQQDAFLPYVERGDIVLVGATTENPSFEVNGALLSRCRVVPLDPLTPRQITALLERALGDAEHGLGSLGLAAEPDALAQIAQLAAGDARRALGLLELAAADAHAAGQGVLDPSQIERVAQRKVLLYDKSGEEHFNLISALHKSLRESDPDAALYWLARMIESGEEPRYIARRLVRFASEDIGLADPRALSRTLDAWRAYERLGSPEGDLALAQAVLYLAMAPKSHAVYAAWKAAKKVLAERPADPVPKALRNAPTRLMEDLGYGDGYIYAHDTADGIGGLACLPDALADSVFYRPSGRGFEARLEERLRELAALRHKAREASRDD